MAHRRRELRGARPLSQHGCRKGPALGLDDLDDALDAAVKAKAKAAAIAAFERATWRTDQLAYGGVKDSGIGREGPRYSIRDMTEERMVLFNY